MRVQSLDVLRGSAIIMVLVTHAWGERNDSIGRIAKLGSYGVDLFFVLSGFLISSILFTELKETGRIDLRRFWLRRGLKIWPSYYGSYGLAVLLLGARALRHGRPEELGSILHGSVPNLLFLQTYWHYESRWPVSWSLAVEEHFYLALPLLLLLIRRRVPLLPWLSGMMIVLVPLLRLHERISNPLEADTLLWIQTHFRIDGLCWGVLIGYLNLNHGHQLARIARYPASIVFLSILGLAISWRWPWGSGVTETLGLAILSTGFAGLLILALVHPRIGERGLSRLVARTGVYSYTIYLAQAIAWATPASHGLPFLGASVGLGLIISHCIERPMLRCRKHLLPPSVSRPRLSRSIDPAHSEAPDHSVSGAVSAPRG